MKRKMQIKILSKLKAELLSHSISVPAAVISITGTEAEEPEADIDTENPNVKAVFRMKFNDIDYGEDGFFDLSEPKQEDFNGLKSFIDNLPEDIQVLIVHCGAGVSRSGAVGAAVDEYLDLGHDFWYNKHIFPNLLVYHLCCNELNIRKTQEEMEEAFRYNRDHFHLFSS